jgi:Holliday junction resolvasome RuvABC DNA-binding subunit
MIMAVPMGRLAAAGADAAAKAFKALRRLGFGEGDVRRALADVAHEGSIDGVEQLVRRYLSSLTERVDWPRARAG